MHKQQQIDWISIMSAQDHGNVFNTYINNSFQILFYAGMCCIFFVWTILQLRNVHLKDTRGKVIELINFVTPEPLKYDGKQFLNTYFFLFSSLVAELIFFNPVLFDLIVQGSRTHLYIFFKKLQNRHFSLHTHLYAIIIWHKKMRIPFYTIIYVIVIAAIVAIHATY